MNDTMTIFGNEKIWRGMSDPELDDYIEAIFNHYREVGYPYYPTDSEYRRKEFSKFMRYDGDVIDGDRVRQTMHGLGLAWSYFPHAASVVCNDKLTPLQAFEDDDIFRKVIRKRLKYGTYMSDSGMRKMLRMYSGVQGVSNFRPTAARAIYDLFGGGVVWDMSCGWGGRLLGAIKSKVTRYIGTDPSTKTYDGLIDMATDFGDGTDIELHCLGSEKFVPESDSLDMCFTSPPYFDLEKYSDEDTQSYKVGSTYEAWLDNYLTPTIENCHTGLCVGRPLIINIASTKKYSLPEDVIRICTLLGFEYVREMKLALSNPKFGSTSYKYEPILIFRKR